MNWLKPVRPWQGYKPVVSDGYSAEASLTHREHHGVDVMFKRSGVADAMFPADGTSGSRMFFMPPDVEVVAAEAGRIWSAKQTSGGWSVVIDHGKPWVTYYQHLSKLFIPARAAGAGGPSIARGEPIGLVGGSPTGYPLRHLHFEMWRSGGAAQHVDPQGEGFDSWPIPNAANRGVLRAGALIAVGVGLWLAAKGLA